MRLQWLVAALWVMAALAAASDSPPEEDDFDLTRFGDEIDEELPDGMNPTPLTRLSTPQELESFILSPPNVVILFGGGVVGFFPKADDDMKAFEEFGRTLDGNGFRIAVSVGNNSLNAYIGATDTWKIYVYTPPTYSSELYKDRPKHRYGGRDLESDAGRAQLKQFMLKNYLPLASRISPTIGNERLFVERELPVFVLIVQVNEVRDAKGVTYLLNRIRKVGDPYRDKMIFAILDKDEAYNTMRFQRKFFIKNEREANKAKEIVGIKDGKSYYTMPTPFSVATASKFVEDFFAGKLQVTNHVEDIIDVPEETDEDFSKLDL